MKNRLAGGLTAILLLAGCAQLPAPPPTTARDAIGDFTVDGRFALKITAIDGRAENSGGRLSWTHANGGDRVLLANPLGIGIAEIDAGPGRASLRTSDGKTWVGDDADRLLAEVTGQLLPVSRLPAWLLGRASPAGTLERDARTRPLRLQEDGWLIEYRYDDAMPDALPTLLTIVRDGSIELKLRIENWQDQQ